MLTQEPRSATVRADDDGQVPGAGARPVRGADPPGADHRPGHRRHAQPGLKAASHEIARTNHVILEAVEQELLQLSPERRASCLQAGLLDEVSTAALLAMFGSRAAEVAADLAA